VISSASRPQLRRGLPPRAVWILTVALCLAAPVAYLLLDKPVFDWLSQRGGLEVRGLWIDAFRLLGKAWLLVWLLLIWVAITGRWRLALLALLALLVMAVPVNSLKVLVGRPRPREQITAAQAPPEALTENVELRGVSFPSGDTAAAFAVAAALGTAWAWPWAVVALVAAGGVGAMRVVDLAHYPSDVFAGAAIGILSAWGAAQLMRLGSPPAIETWGRAAALLGVIGIPIALIFTHGIPSLLLLSKTYIPLILATYCVGRVWLRVRATRANRC
jgi:membrane-associated phospholipid phosphatase